MKLNITLLFLFTSSCLLPIRSFAQTNAPGSTVTIGSQVWTAKNLAVTAFANGDKIGQAQSNEEWLKAGNEKRAAWCYYENDTEKGKMYGVLYNWFAVADLRGLIPKGWHVPSKAEWMTTATTLGGVGDAGDKLKSSTGWQTVSSIDRNGSNSSGFNGLPAGLRFAADGKFDALGIAGHFWTSTQHNGVSMQSVNIGIGHGIAFGPADMKFGYSIRLVKD